MKVKNKKEIKNPYMVCGLEVKWGENGCPVVNQGSEIGVLFGSWLGMKHYKSLDEK